MQTQKSIFNKQEIIDDYTNGTISYDRAIEILTDEMGIDSSLAKNLLLKRDSNKDKFFESIYNKARRVREDFTERDYEVKYEKGCNGPWEAIWRQANAEPNRSGTNKPAIKGTPHFKYEKAADGNNKPSCPEKNKEIKYGGSLNEKNWKRPAFEVLCESLKTK